MDEEEREARPEVADETDEKHKSEAPAAERNQMKRYQKLPARYEGRCKSCSTKIRVGDPMVWDTDEKKAYCAECGMEMMLDQGVDEEDD